MKEKLGRGPGPGGVCQGEEESGPAGVGTRASEQVSEDPCTPPIWFPHPRQPLLSSCPRSLSPGPHPSTPGNGQTQLVDRRAMGRGLRARSANELVFIPSLSLLSLICLPWQHCRYFQNTSRSWRKKAFETTSSSSMSCWTS